MQQTPQQRPRPCRAGFRELCIATAALMLAGGLSGGSAGAAPQVRTANDGQLIMQDVPPIPAELADSLRRFQNTRSAVLFDWTGDGEGLYISTRFAATAQIHRVMQPGGAREQLTWFNDAVGSAVRQRGTEMLAFTMDAGGNEFSQIFFLDPADRQARMVSDGVSRNGALLWSHDGSQLAFASTRRDGAANDIWLMSPQEPETARLLLAADDGALQRPTRRGGEYRRHQQLRDLSRKYRKLPARPAAGGVWRRA